MSRRSDGYDICVLSAGFQPSINAASSRQPSGIPDPSLLEMKREGPTFCESSCHTVLTFSKRFHRRSHFTALHVPALFHASLETTWQTATCANAARQANALHRLVFTHEERVLLLPSSHLRAAVWLAIRQKYANRNANVSATNACSLPLH